MISRKGNATRARNGASVTGGQFKNKSQNNYNPYWLKAIALTALNLALLVVLVEVLA